MANPLRTTEDLPPSPAGVVFARRAALLGAVSAATVATAGEKAEAFGANPSDWLGYYKDWGWVGPWGNGLGIDSWEFYIILLPWIILILHNFTEVFYIAVLYSLLGILEDLMGIHGNFTVVEHSLVLCGKKYGLYNNSRMILQGHPGWGNGNFSVVENVILCGSWWFYVI